MLMLNTAAQRWQFADFAAAEEAGWRFAASEKSSGAGLALRWNAGKPTFAAWVAV